MSNYDEKLYKVLKKDIQKTGSVFANAFKHDPIWEAVLQGINVKNIQGFFEGPAKYGIKYGEVYATSENLEGIAAWVPSKNADMTLWRGVLSGSMISGMKLGLKNILKIGTIFKPLEESRKEKMMGRTYIYFMILGVAPEFQGKGFGKKLLNAILKESEKYNIPIYLETATEKNIKMYEKFGFEVLNKIIHPIINLPQWAMLREPGLTEI